MTRTTNPPNVLALLRQQKGFTQHDVAFAMGVSQARVAYIERMDIEALVVSTLIRYFRAIGAHLRLVTEIDGEDLTILQ